MGGIEINLRENDCFGRLALEAAESLYSDLAICPVGVSSFVVATVEVLRAPCPQLGLI